MSPGRHGISRHAYDQVRPSAEAVALRQSAYGRCFPVLVLLAVVVGLGLRLWLAAGHYGNYDQTSFHAIAGIIEEGKNLYAETHRYNYSPLWAHVLWGLHRITAATDLPFHFVVRSFLTLVDVSNAIFIGLIAARFRRERAALGLLAYLLNPVAILIVGYHGQFDNLAALPLLAAIWVATKAPRPPLWLIWCLGTLALIVKHLNIFCVWMLFFYVFATKRRAISAFALSVLAFLVTFIPYVPRGLPGIIENVFLYAGISRPYGIRALLPLAIAYPIFVLLLALLPLVAKARWQFPLPIAMALAAVTLLVLIPGSGEAYFILPVIFGSAVRGLGYWTYSLVTYGFLLTGPNNLQVVSGHRFWNLVWLALVFWLLILWKRGETDLAHIASSTARLQERIRGKSDASSSFGHPRLV